MSQRIKPTPHIVDSLAAAEGTLAEIAALDRKVRAVEAEMQEAIDLAKARASQASAPLLARRKALSDGVAVFARLNKAELFLKVRSLDLGFGVMGFRQSTKIVQMPGVNVDTTIARIKQYALADGIRIKEELNKDAMNTWPDERLEMVGLRRQQGDTFYIEIAADKVPQDAA